MLDPRRMQNSNRGQSLALTIDVGRLISTQFANRLCEPEGEQILAPTPIVIQLHNSATENLLRVLKRCRNMIAAHVRLLVIRISERNTRPAFLVVKHEPK